MLVTVSADDAEEVSFWGFLDTEVEEVEEAKRRESMEELVREARKGGSMRLYRGGL